MDRSVGQEGRGAEPKVLVVCPEGLRSTLTFVPALEAIYRVSFREPSESDVSRLVVDASVVLLIEPDRTSLIRWCEACRVLVPRPAILLVSTHHEQHTEAFHLGVDDCASALSVSAMLERVRVNTMRVRAHGSVARPQRSVRTISGTLSLDLGPLLSFNGVPLDLSRVHSRLLRSLLESERPMTTKDLAVIGWPDERVAVHTVHTQINLLRARLAELDLEITHERGRGYALRRLSKSTA